MPSPYEAFWTKVPAVFLELSQYSRVRKAMLDCGPGPTTVGLLDSMRIELDLAHLTWDQYAKNFNSNAPAMAKRYYFHKRT